MNKTCKITLSVVSTKTSKFVGHFQPKLKEFYSKKIISSKEFYERLTKRQKAEDP